MESAATPSLAWKWILEKLIDLPNFGMKFIYEVIRKHIPDIEEPHCQPLLKRLALRNLEDMVVTNQIDCGAIPLLKEFIGQGSGPGTAKGSYVMQRANEELVLRIQTEVVLRRIDVDEGEINWAFYEAELERVFGDAEEDNRLLDRKRELSALLKPKNQTEAIIASYLKKYSFRKLRRDLFSFIEETRESFPVMFLNQLARDSRDANGMPFAEDVEKPTNVDANGKEYHVGQTLNVKDQHVALGTAMTSGKKRLRRKLLLTQDDIHDDESDEAEEGSAGRKKARNNSLPSIVKPLLLQGVLELAVPESGRRSDCLSMKQDAESLLNRGEEPSSGLGNLGMRNCSRGAHEGVSMELENISPREPSRTSKYVTIPDVDSDAEMQSGSGQGHLQSIVEAEVVREEISIVRTEQKALADRKEASKNSPKVEVCQQEGHEDSATKDIIYLDSEDTYDIVLEVGSDGHENVCHTCGKPGDVVHCDGCPVSMHFDCIKRLSLTLPSCKKVWYCPICLSRRIEAEAKKAADLAKENIKAFKMESKKKAGKKRRLRISSLESRESDRALKAKQQSDGEPKQGQRNSDPCMESTALKKGLHLRQKNPDRSLRADKPPSSRLVTSGKGVDDNNVGRALLVNEKLVSESPNSFVKSGAESIRDVSAKPRKTQPAHDQEVSRRDLFAASTSGQVRRERERFARCQKKEGTGAASDEECGEEAAAGVPEPGSGAGDRGEMEDDEDDEELEEDCSEDAIHDALIRGRQRIPGVRRKPLPWKRQEELALKEGVKRYSNNGSWGFQWKRILEFGQGRFHPTRTDVDLKDKWRNLVKAVS